MLAKDFIAERIKEGFQDQAHLIAHIDSKEWHVQQDEEVPLDRELSIDLKCEGYIVAE